MQPSNKLGVRAASDIDPISVQIATAVIESAVEAGPPSDTDAASAALRGPGAAAAVQSALNRADGPVEHVHAMDTAALDSASLAADHANAAQRETSARAALRRESVTVLDGSVLTRGQVAGGMLDRQRAAAGREGRGDFEHRESPPGAALRVAVVVTLSMIDLFLLLVPVTNASTTEPLSLAYVAGLLVLLVLMNDTLPLLTGRAFRDHREQLHAVWDKAGVDATSGLRSDGDRSRTAAEQADLRRLWTANRHRIGWSIAFATVVAVYGPLVFTRVFTLASRLWTATPLTAGLAASLISACTVSAPLFLAWRWSRGNRLGDQMREYGGIIAESRALAEEAAADARGLMAQALRAADEARRALVFADEDGARAAAAVAVGLQIAADRLGLQTVVGPTEKILFPVHREARDHAEKTLIEVKNILTAVATSLESDPFPAEGPAPDPWGGRIHPRPARAASPRDR